MYRYVCMLSCFSRVSFFMNLWTAAHQTSLFMGLFQQEYWSGLPCLPPGDLLNPAIEPESPISPALAGGFFFLPLLVPGKPQLLING